MFNQKDALKNSWESTLALSLFLLMLLFVGENNTLVSSLLEGHYLKSIKKMILRQSVLGLLLI